MVYPMMPIAVGMVIAAPYGSKQMNLLEIE